MPSILFWHISFMARGTRDRADRPDGSMEPPRDSPAIPIDFQLKLQFCLEGREQRGFSPLAAINHLADKLLVTLFNSKAFASVVAAYAMNAAERISALDQRPRNAVP